jgi:hypothetical protein
MSEMIGVKNAMANRIEELRKENNAFRFNKATVEMPMRMPPTDPFTIMAEYDLYKGLIEQLRL